jgi:DNA-binding NarL/FixJ family response regulator
MKERLKLILLHIGDMSAGSPEVRADVDAINHLLNGTPIVLLGQGSDPSQSVEALHAGARGYFAAETPAEIIKHALPLIVNGGFFAPPFLYAGPGGNDALRGVSSAPPQVADLAKELSSLPADYREDLAIFTQRELEVLRLLGNGLPNKLIAYRLSLREGTVKVHMRNIMKKLKVASRTQAALFASRHFEMENNLT